MAYVYLGNLTVEQIERRYGFSFTEAERTRLKELWHQNAEFKDGDAGWHMFDIPEFMELSNGPVGNEVLTIFQAHSHEMHGSFPAGYGCKEGDAE